MSNVKGKVKRRRSAVTEEKFIKLQEEILEYLNVHGCDLKTAQEVLKVHPKGYQGWVRKFKSNVKVLSLHGEIKEMDKMNKINGKVPFRRGEDRLPPIESIKSDWYRYKKTNPPFLTYEGFATFLKVDDLTLLNWRKRESLSEEHKQFFRNIRNEMLDEALLFFRTDQMGAKAIFWLKARFGFRESEVEIRQELEERRFKHQAKMDKEKLKLQQETDNEQVVVNVSFDPDKMK